MKMPKLRIFLDTMILKRAFIMSVNREDWRAHFKLSSDFELVTSQKNVAEMYGILKTSVLESDLKVYGCASSKGLRDLLFDGSEFLNIYWHHHQLENRHRTNLEPADESGKKLQALIEWRNCYEKVCADFDKFLKTESIEWVHYGVLFAQHEWQWKIIDLARESLMPSEDWEIIAAACFAQADIFLTCEKKLVRFSFSLGLESAPVFCTPESFEAKVKEKMAGVISFSDGK
jgi:hypothetical protein